MSDATGVSTPTRSVVDGFRKFFSDRGRKAPAAAEVSSETIRRLAELNAENRRLLGIAGTEAARAAECGERIAQIEKDRGALLIRARVDGDAAAGEEAARLAREVDELRRGVADANAVAANVTERAAAVRGEIESLRYAYGRERGACLDALHARAIERYNSLAPQVRDAVIEVAAIHRVMMELRVGNSNGWNGRVYLPGMEAGNGGEIPPILDGAEGGHRRAAEECKARVYEALREAGFTQGT